MGQLRVRRVPLLLVLVTSLIVAPTHAVAQTQGRVDGAKEDVDDARAVVAAARAEYEAVAEDLEAAVAEYQLVTGNVEDLTYRVSQLTDRVATYEGDLRNLRLDAKQRAISAYMAGGTDLLDVFFEAGSFQEVVTTQQILEYAAKRDVVMLDRLLTTKREMERLREELRSDQEEVVALREQADVLVAGLDALQARKAEILADADDELHAAIHEYEAARKAKELEDLRRRLAELARQRGAAAGAPAAAVAGFRCPFNVRPSFINDWGFPRSGGRTHKGTDIFVSRGTPMVAVVSGTIRLTNNRLGGLSVHLTADNGTRYYYAHLDGYASGISSGTRVSQGTVVGYNGDSGNARGGSPHLHFQIHPGGGSPVNPYPTLVQACR